MLGRPVVHIELSAQEREALTRLMARRKTAQDMALRARIVLACGEGLSSKAAAERLGVCEKTVGKWRRRFSESRLDGLYDEPRPGGPRTITDDRVEAVVVRTLESQPKNATPWSSRAMAKASGVSTSSVQRIWRAFGLQPHRAETFKRSTDPLFVDTVRDVVGLYLNPPERALVLCVDEKSQIQALDRSQPILPLRPGTPERRTHGYTRHGTPSLFAALDAATGDVIGKCYNRHRAVEFKKFLAEIEGDGPADMDIHIVMDNYATHKTPQIRAWFARRPRWHAHFTPTGAAWLNMVDRVFAELTEKPIKRGAHRSVGELKAAITTFIEKRNETPKPFRWVRTADQILAAVRRFCERLSPMPGHGANS